MVRFLILKVLCEVEQIVTLVKGLSFQISLIMGKTLSCWLDWGEWQVGVDARPRHTNFYNIISV